ncbi:Utp21 specific WD40 associated putative domain-containing protein [Hygrophoropsis aurantiaca]|uniref:Utp21 specific WD40 associated putative domain-containing protein n=1 Tax=Hygrophoropsis aurantiaca TaxID=72124 RepID=A0ACB8AH16_9AGAM|nr:Utp21 specific WD40 associated putative domain-containing protein [Hygrophoropsis aurantiaca]
MSVINDVEATEVRPRKKIRTSSSKQKAKAVAITPNEPRLFVPFRALGLITNHIPFSLQTRSHKGATDGPRIHLLTCLGRSWAMWEGGKMGLLFVGPEASDDITCLTMDGDAVWAASGIHVIKYLRGKEVARVTNPIGTKLSSITIFGSQLLALTEDGGRMFIWDISSPDLTLFCTIQFDIGFTAVFMLHPATYVNKILVASAEGDLQLWNIRTQTCIHKFAGSKLLTLPTQNTSSTPPSAITALTQSPAIDVVGIGFTSGEISVYDVRADERLMRMYMDNGGIRALSFRSDGHHILASASSSGHIALWDLNSGGRLLHLVRGAHDGAVSSLEWVPGQPVLISSGEDNSIKQWLFDSPTAAPRLLKFRSGHHAPPHLIRYYGEDGKQLLTASTDRSLRYTSVVRDSRSFEMSQGSLARKATTLSKPLASLKFSPITAVAYSSTRSKDWDDVLTSHTDEPLVRSWTVQSKRLGKHTFNYQEGSKRKAQSGSVKSVCVTACGNFGLAGSTTGEIHMWNMQSGLKRKTFKIGPCPQTVIDRLESSTKPKASERCITGLASDALNRVVIASTQDGTINFFDFHTTKLDHTLVIPATTSSITLHRDTGLLAVVCTDKVVRIVDIETRRIVRELPCGIHGRILDIAFSPDSRWLVAASLDSVIRTFDIPTGRLIDAFRTPSVATSIAFSPTNDFLATAHVDSVGVFLWANRAQYGEIAFRTVSESQISESALPAMQGVTEDEDEALEGLSALTMEDTPVDVFSTPPQLDGDLVTLTLLPRARWQTLLNLEVIQQRNKPKEPPKKPEQAPFFLPTLPGVEQRFAIEQKEDKKSEKPSRRLDKIAARTKSVFQKKLLEFEDGNGEDGFFDYIKSLSPAAVDLELRSLVDIDNLRQFLHALKQRLLSHRDFEAVQTLQNVFLRIHADIIIENIELREELESLLEVQRRESERVLELLASSLGTLGFVRDTM